MRHVFLLRLTAACLLATFSACGAGVAIVGTAATPLATAADAAAPASTATATKSITAVTGSIEPPVCLHCAP